MTGFVEAGRFGARVFVADLFAAGVSAADAVAVDVLAAVFSALAGRAGQVLWYHVEPSFT